MAIDDRLLDTVGSLHEASLDPQAWPPALSRFGRLVRGSWTVLGVLRRDGRPELVTQSDGDAEQLAVFRDRYNHPDTNPAIPPLLAAGPGAVIVREEVQSDAEWRACGLYRDVYRPLGLYHGLGAHVLSNASHTAFVGTNRRAAGGHFARRDIECVRTALPHLRHALEVSLRLAAVDARARLDAHEAIWDALPCGMLLLDAAGRILWANRSALRVLEQGDGLRMRDGRLIAADARDNATLQSLTQRALATSGGRILLPGGSVSVRRPSRRRPFAVLVSPVCPRPTDAQPSSGVVFISDSERYAEPEPELLRRLYGLTPREAALVVLLLNGEDLRSASERLRVSILTARSHLSAVFRKTQTRRQSELVAFLLRGLAGLR